MPQPGRGGSGIAPAEGIEFIAYARMEPEKLVSGFLTIMVRNIDGAETTTPEDDIETKMHDDWDNLFPTSTPISSVAGQFPNMAAVGSFENELGLSSTSLKAASRLAPRQHRVGGGTHYNRDDWGQSLGDHDVFIYHLTCGFHINGPTQTSGIIPFSFTTGYDHDGSPHSVGYGKWYSGTDVDDFYGLVPGTSDDNTWADYIQHYGCQSFVRYSLISRHNSAYHHDAVYDVNWTNDSELHDDDVHDEWDEQRHYNYYTSFSKRKEWHVRRPNMASNEFPDPWQAPGNTKNIETGLIDDYHDRYDDMEHYDSSLTDWGHHATYGKAVSVVDHPKAPGAWTGAGSPIIDQNVFNTGIASAGVNPAVGYVHIPNADPYGGKNWAKNSGAVGTQANVGIDLSDGDDGLSRNNTFMNPVFNIKIWGEHPLQVEDHPSGVSNSENGHTLVKLKQNGHPLGFYDLGVSVKVWGCNTGTDTSTEYPELVNADKKFIKDRIQVFYQPFGESDKVKFSINYRGIAAIP